MGTITIPQFYCHAPQHTTPHIVSNSTSRASTGPVSDFFSSVAHSVLGVAGWTGHWHLVSHKSIYCMAYDEWMNRVPASVGSQLLIHKCIKPGFLNCDLWCIGSSKVLPETLQLRHPTPSCRTLQMVVGGSARCIEHLWTDSVCWERPTCPEPLPSLCIIPGAIWTWTLLVMMYSPSFSGSHMFCVCIGASQYAKDWEALV